MKRTIETWFACIAIMCTCMTSFAASSATYSKHITFRKTPPPSSGSDDDFRIGTFSLTESDETLYGILTPNGVLTIELAPVTNKGAYITIYSEDEVIDYIYAADSVSIDFNEYEDGGHYTIVVAPISGDVKYVANI